MNAFFMPFWPILALNFTKQRPIMTDPTNIIIGLVLAIAAALIPPLARSYRQRSEASIHHQQDGDQ
jgi:hypothetical protein